MSMASPCSDAVAKAVKLSNSFTFMSTFMVGDTAAASQCLPMITSYGIDSHVVKTPGDLSSTLDTVVDTIASEACKIDVHSQVADPKTVTLLFDGAEVPYDAVNGWTWDDPTSISLTVNGTFCRTLVESTPRIDLVAGCLPGHN